MESTAEHAETTEPTLARLRATKDSLADVDREVEALIADAEALADRLLIAADPAVTRLGRRVGQAVADTKRALARGSDTLQRQARSAVGAADHYAHQSPWQIVGAVAILAAAVGFAAARR